MNLWRNFSCTHFWLIISQESSACMHCVTIFFNSCASERERERFSDSNFLRYASDLTADCSHWTSCACAFYFNLFTETKNRCDLFWFSLQLSDERSALHLLKGGSERREKSDDNSSIVAIFLIRLAQQQPQQDNSFHFFAFLRARTFLIFVMLLALLSSLYQREWQQQQRKNCLHLCYTRVISVYWCSFF